MMSCRSSVRGGAPGPQPLRATVRYQLHGSKAPPARTGEKVKGRPPKPSIRRTLSLDAIVAPYLQGQWPKEQDSQTVGCVNDKATQTPSLWLEQAPGKKADGVHKRSASWGSAEHLKEFVKVKQQLRSKQVSRGGREREQPSLLLPSSLSLGTTQTSPIPILPLARFTPRLHHSVEGLNQELEGVFGRELPEDQQRILDVPDGHRAPVPPQRCSSSSQSDHSPALLSSSPSPCPSLSPYPLGDIPSDPDPDFGVCGTLCLPSSPLHPSGIDVPLLQLSSSPRPNKSYSFKREPPEGCERVRVCEETHFTSVAQFSSWSSSPDPNKINFTPHGGSAFCPVSLLKPLLPSMDFLFRNLSVSPGSSCSPQGAAPYQTAATAVGGYRGSLPDTATTAI